MLYRLFFFILLFLPALLFAQKKFDVQGHRGARGLYPENSIVGFIEALKLGVSTLEMDVVVSKDGKLIVSHEPYMKAAICRDKNGNTLKDEKEKYNIYTLTYDEIKQFDCGSWGNPDFQQQKKVSTNKPLLSDVIDAVEKYIAHNNLPKVQYNIETKSKPERDNIFHPIPKEFSKLLYDLLKSKNILNRCIIQSFDVRTLQEVIKIDSSVTTALIIDNIEGLEANIKKLGFIPDMYSPNFRLVTKELIKKCHEKNILIIPWTVNEEKEMIELKEMGVDGIISDYPNKAVKLYLCCRITFL